MSGRAGTAARETLAVGVHPAAERERLSGLLAALEEAFPVGFEGRGVAELRDLDGVLDLGGGRLAAAATEVGLPSLRLLDPEPGEADGAATAQRLTDAPELDRRLRDAVLPDARLGAALGAGGGLEPPPGADVLAEADGVPTWFRAGPARTALLQPAELGPEEALRERLGGERSAALLPLVHFLRELTAAIAWQPPPARAAMLFDDPNLHWPSYGCVDLRELSRHAREHGYHAALATIPLDGWFAHPAALRALAESEGRISLVVHGNDHDGGELGRTATAADALALAAQAQRRVAAFERRTGAAVDRVMVPPHERCSEATVRALLRCGFDGISMTLPFPWLAEPPHDWLARPAAAGPLVGWRPADFTRGLPLLLRHPLAGRSPAELALRAFLDQPLILYGHHDDLRDGLDVLAEAAAEVDGLGPTRWCSLAEIAAGNFETRVAGSSLSVRPLTRRASFEVPDGIETLRVEVSDAHGEAAAQELLVDGRPAELGEQLAVAPGATARIELRPRDAVDVASVPAPRRRPLALPRRLASEGRDRLMPLVARAR